MSDALETHPVSALFVGLPKAGKTTYLALAYGTIIDDDACGVALDAYDCDLAYLNRVLAALQEFRPADHTEVGETEGMNLNLRFDKHGPARIKVPDLSGETWQSVHVERVWDSDLVGIVSQCSGFILFTNVDDHKAVQTVTEHQADAEALGDQEWNIDNPHSHGIGDAPTQLALVDLVQALCREHKGLVRLSVVLSAYDAARPHDITPVDWIGKNLPLLSQYLVANADRIESREFGVSGQGGSYPPTPEQEAIPLLERAYVRRPDGRLTTLLAPLLWALGHDDED